MPSFNIFILLLLVIASHFDNVTAPLLPTIWWSSLLLLQDHWLQHLELNGGVLPWLDEGVAVPGLG